MIKLAPRKCGANHFEGLTMPAYCTPLNPPLDCDRFNQGELNMLLGLILFAESLKARNPDLATAKAKLEEQQRLLG